MTQTIKKGRKPISDKSKLRRQNGIVAGMCGGLGAFFGLNA